MEDKFDCLDLFRGLVHINPLASTVVGLLREKKVSKDWKLLESGILHNTCGKSKRKHYNCNDLLLWDDGSDQINDWSAVPDGIASKGKAQSGFHSMCNVRRFNLLVQHHLLLEDQ